MASKTIYPPTIDSSLPAFQVNQANEGYCRIYFSLSKFNSTIDFPNNILVHVSIVKQDTNMNVVRLQDDAEEGIYRATGIIINIVAQPVVGKDNLFYFDLTQDNLVNGWQPGWKYKIQIRLSTVKYIGSSQIDQNSNEELQGQSTWLNENSSNFSEWSTVCVTKAIGRIYVNIPSLKYDSNPDVKEDTTADSNSIINTLYSSTLDFFGDIDSIDDKSEVLYKYNLKLYDNSNDNLLEDSGDLFSNSFQDNNSFRYLFKYELKDKQTYKIVFTYETNNGFIETHKFIRDISLIQLDTINCYLVTVDNDNEKILTDLTTLEDEEEEGRIAFKLHSTMTDPYNGNICIRRSSAKDNFTEWIDIKIIIVKNKIIDTLPIIYDYSIESGVYYKYGVQSIDKDGTRGVLVQNNPIMRNFEHSYLLGENNQQLKLMFNNTMPSYKIQVMDNKTEPISGTYPIITRNAALKYRIFPINGLISFWMDENNLFCNKKVIYNNEEIINLYTQYNTKNNIKQYDYIYERDFRKLVLDFLHDGKPKLFKSPTEGNIIVRLTDINCTPNQSLDRMIYEFSGTGNEIAKTNNENYIKYGFINSGTWSSDFFIYETKLGQIQMDFPIGVNIFKEIYKKYDSQGMNLAGYTKTLGTIHHLKITIEDKPLRIINSAGEFIVGNNLKFGNKIITIYNPQRVYEFDSRLSYTADNSLSFEGDAEGKVSTVRATVDFLYELQSEVYQEKQIESREVKIGIGQLFDNYKPGTSLRNEIYAKYYIKWDTTFRELNSLSAIEIETYPGCVFGIKDSFDTDMEIHEIGDTGVLNLYELSNIKEIKYIGIRNKNTGIIDTTKSADILLNYKYNLVKGTYKG